MGWLDAAWDFLKVNYPKIGGLIGILTFIGGISAYVGNVMAARTLEKYKSKLGNELERLKSELGMKAEFYKSELGHEADTYRLQLKKRELIFNKELEAASAYMLMYRSILPSYSHPDMDWNEACETAALSFGSHEQTISKFLIEYGAMVSTPIRKNITDCMHIASNYKFDSHDSEFQISAEATKKADEFLTTLSEIQDKIIDDVRSWEFL